MSECDVNVCDQVILGFAPLLNWSWIWQKVRIKRHVTQWRKREMCDKIMKNLSWSSKFCLSGGTQCMMETFHSHVASLSHKESELFYQFHVSNCGYCCTWTRPTCSNGHFSTASLPIDVPCQWLAQQAKLAQVDLWIGCVVTFNWSDLNTTTAIPIRWLEQQFSLMER